MFVATYLEDEPEGLCMFEVPRLPQAGELWRIGEAEDSLVVATVRHTGEDYPYVPLRSGSNYATVDTEPVDFKVSDFGISVPSVGDQLRAEGFETDQTIFCVEWFFNMNCKAEWVRLFCSPVQANLMTQLQQ